ncbi:DUF4124 domain-containing protein [Ramlibacter sp.]|uniref:DUF4124 domain-containing protein n=1 Tax=Ramlibacter sp. TaxID=1917967 RepID=UPI0026048334|nr:DUF4124 domain-containing protein [Ramlibacter sp.]
MALIHTFRLVCLAGALLSGVPLSLAQPTPSSGTSSASGAAWVWTDANGRRVFSDRPPPADVPDRRILRQPSAAWPDALPRVDALAVPQSPASAPATLPAGPGSTAQRPASPPQSAASARLLAERAEQTERDRVTALRAENCRRARGALATLDSGIRLATTNDKGEREILGEAARAAEARRLREIMASDCAAP